MSKHNCRGMIHPSAEVAERPPASTLTKNGSCLEVWQQGVPGERWIDCQLATEVPVVLLPTRPSMLECLPNKEPAIRQHVPGLGIRGTGGHICHKAIYP